MLENLKNSKIVYDRSVQPFEEKEIVDRVDRTYQVLKNDLISVRNELDDLKRELDYDEDEFDDTEKQLMQTTIASYYVNLKNKLNEAQKHYSDFKEFSKKKITHQIKNIDIERKYTDEQINQMAEDDPESLGKMVQRQIMGKASIQLQNTAQDIAEKCEGIKRLNKNAKELMDMFKEIAELAKLQGEQVNTIAEHVSVAKNHVEKAHQNLIKAKDHHQAARCVS